MKAPQDSANATEQAPTSSKSQEVRDFLLRDKGKGNTAAKNFFDWRGVGKPDPSNHKVDIKRAEKEARRAVSRVNRRGSLDSSQSVKLQEALDRRLSWLFANPAPGEERVADVQVSTKRAASEFSTKAVAESSARRASDGTDYPPCNKQPVGVPRASRSPGGAESLFTVKPAAPPAGTVPLSPWAPVPANVQRARAGRKPPEATPSRHANNLVDWIGSQIQPDDGELKPSLAGASTTAESLGPSHVLSDDKNVNGPTGAAAGDPAGKTVSFARGRCASAFAVMQAEHAEGAGTSPIAHLEYTRSVLEYNPERSCHSETWKETLKNKELQESDKQQLEAFAGDELEEVRKSKYDRLHAMVAHNQHANKQSRAHRDKWIIDPISCSSYKYWDLSLILALCVVVTITPYEVGFLDTELNWLFFLNRIIDLVFVVDMILQFFTAFQRPNSIWCYSIPEIRTRYLTSWFLPDLVTSLPYDAMPLLFPKNPSTSMFLVLRTLRVLKLGKMYRVLRVSRIFSRIETSMSIDYSTLQLIGYFVSSLLTMHWAACGLMLVTDLQDMERTWVDAYFEDQGKFDSTNLDRYLAALYWSGMTFTTIGYGDVIMQTTAERIYVIISMMVGATAYGYILSVVTVILMAGASRASEFYFTMEHLNTYMSVIQLPNHLRMRLREYFRFRSSSPLDSDQVRELLRKMSPEMRGEMAIVEGGLWMNYVPYLKNCHESLAVNLAMSMESTIFAPLEHIVEVGASVQHIYVVTKGFVLHRGQIMSLTSNSALSTECLLDLDHMARFGATALNFVNANMLSATTALSYMSRYADVMQKYHHVRRWFLFKVEVVAYASALKHIRLYKQGLSSKELEPWVMAKVHPRVLHYMTVLTKYIEVPEHWSRVYQAAAISIQKCWRSYALRNAMTTFILNARLAHAQHTATKLHLDDYQRAMITHVGQLSKQVDGLMRAQKTMYKCIYRSQEREKRIDKNLEILVSQSKLGNKG